MSSASRPSFTGIRLYLQSVTIISAARAKAGNAEHSRCDIWLYTRALRQGVSWQASEEDSTTDARCCRGAPAWGSRGSGIRGAPSSQTLPRGAGSNRVCDEHLLKVEYLSEYLEHLSRLVPAVPTQPSARSAYSDGAALLLFQPVGAASLHTLPVLAPPLLLSCPHSLSPPGPLPPARASWRHR